MPLGLLRPPAPKALPDPRDPPVLQGLPDLLAARVRQVPPVQRRQLLSARQLLVRRVVRHLLLTAELLAPLHLTSQSLQALPDLRGLLAALVLLVLPALPALLVALALREVLALQGRLAQLDPLGQVR